MCELLRVTGDMDFQYVLTRCQTHHLIIMMLWNMFSGVTFHPTSWYFMMGL